MERNDKAKMSAFGLVISVIAGAAVSGLADPFNVFRLVTECILQLLM